MGQVAEVVVSPLYGQVSVHDVTTTDLPQWETGEESAISSETAVLIATRGDADGDVTMRVVVDEPADGLLVFDGDLTLNEPAIELGSMVGATLERVTLSRAGAISMRVYVQPPDLPDTVTVVLEASSLPG